jgi:DNA-binding NtrC family response regulator
MRFVSIVKQLLLAEPNASYRRCIERDYGERAHIIECRDFQTARARLLERAPDLLVTNLRLVDYNGLHLVLLAKAIDAATVCIVHTDRPDLVLVREAQASGAFFERTERLASALGSYLTALLPDRDRRAPERYDRRVAFRGGRRAADQPAVL